MAPGGAILLFATVSSTHRRSELGAFPERSTAPFARRYVLERSTASGVTRRCVEIRSRRFSRGCVQNHGNKKAASGGTKGGSA